MQSIYIIISANTCIFEYHVWKWVPHILSFELIGRSRLVSSRLSIAASYPCRRREGCFLRQAWQPHGQCIQSFRRLHCYPPSWWKTPNRLLQFRFRECIHHLDRPGICHHHNVNRYQCLCFANLSWKNPTPSHGGDATPWDLLQCHLEEVLSFRHFQGHSPSDIHRMYFE